MRFVLLLIGFLCLFGPAKGQDSGEAMWQAYSPVFLKWSPKDLGGDSLTWSELLQARLKHLLGGTDNPAVLKALKQAKFWDLERPWYWGWLMERDRFEYWIIPITDNKAVNEFLSSQVDNRIGLRGKWLSLVTEQYALVWNKRQLLVILPTWAYTGSYPWDRLEKRLQIERKLTACLGILSHFDQQNSQTSEPLPNWTLNINEGAWWQQRQTMLQDSVYQGSILNLGQELTNWLRGQQFSLSRPRWEGPNWVWDLSGTWSELMDKTWQEDLTWPKNWTNKLGGKPLALGRMDLNFRFLGEYFAALSQEKLLELVGGLFEGQILWRWENCELKTLGSRSLQVPTWIVWLKLSKPQGIEGFLTLLEAWNWLKPLENNLYQLKQEHLLEELYLCLKDDNLILSNRLDLLKRENKFGPSKDKETLVQNGPRAWYLNLEQLEQLSSKQKGDWLGLEGLLQLMPKTWKEISGTWNQNQAQIKLKARSSKIQSWQPWALLWSYAWKTS